MVPGRACRCSTSPIRPSRSRSPIFDRGPINPKQLIGGGYWSAYWYNGYIYGAEIARGIDVFRLKPSEHLSQNEIDAAILVRSTEFNSQNQPKIAWPAVSVVARAYLDQLNRNKAIRPERARAVRDGLDKVDQLRTGKERNAAARARRRSTRWRRRLEGDAKAADGTRRGPADRARGNLKGRAARLR